MSIKIKIALGVVIVGIFSIAAALAIAPKDYDPVTLLRAAPIGTGYAAKMLCSGVFLSGRDPKTILAEDLQLMRNNMIDAKVNMESPSAEGYALGFLFKQKAIFRANCGCTLVIDSTEEQLRQNCEAPNREDGTDYSTLPWPDGNAGASVPSTFEYDRQQIERTLDWAFSEPGPAEGKPPIRTRAVIVIYDGKIVAERYAKGINSYTRLLGWSMTKSVTSAQIGILVRDGKLDVNKPAPVAEWQSPGDPRSAITLDQLLHMNSGLEFVEEYEENPDTDAGFMYFTIKDMAKFAAMKPLIHKPGEKFSYSSGTTMLLARIVRQTVGSNADYHAFVWERLFKKIGMRSAVIEPDPSGTMVGAGFMYATARDWARFGLLYYNDGVWNGERILPEGWVDYTRTAAPSTATYGAQFWLNPEGPERWLPNCPTDIYSTWGHEGQFVTIVPSRKAIIVRLGQTPNEIKNWDHDYFISNILKGLPD